MSGLLDELLNSFEREEDGLEVYYNYYGNVKPSDARAELASLRAESEARRVALEEAKAIAKDLSYVGRRVDTTDEFELTFYGWQINRAADWLEKYGDK